MSSTAHASPSRTSTGACSGRKSRSGRSHQRHALVLDPQQPALRQAEHRCRVFLMELGDPLFACLAEVLDQLIPLANVDVARVVMSVDRQTERVDIACTVGGTVMGMSLVV